MDLLAAIRRAKSEARVGPRSPVERVTVSGPRWSRLTRSAWSKTTSAPPKMWRELVLSVAGDGEPASVEVKLAGSQTVSA